MDTIEICPDFSQGLLPVIVQDVENFHVLMLAWMNAEAWNLTHESGYAHYWSRSRKKIWLKGETSGHKQKVASIRLDCDRDAILLLVKQIGGAACHTGHESCFYREICADGFTECSPIVFNPADVYGNKRA